MKPLIFIIFLFTCFSANAQGKFVQAAYTANSFEGCFGGPIRKNGYTLLIYNDLSVELRLYQYNYNLKFNGTNHSSFATIISGKGVMHRDTLIIKYSQYPVSQPLKKKFGCTLQIKQNITMQAFMPPTIFVVMQDYVFSPTNDSLTLIEFHLQ